MSRITLATLAAMLLLAGAHGAAAQDATTAINSTLVPILVKSHGFPYTAKGLASPKARKIKLTTISRTGNAVTDDERWFADNVLPQPTDPKDEEWRQVPGETRWGELKFFRSDGDIHVGIYQAQTPRKAAQKEKGMGSIYDKEFSYAAVLFNADFAPQKLFVLEEFHPGILEMSDAHLAGKILYFDCNYNGYASIAKKKTGYLVALDLDGERVLWTSRSLVASFRGFVVLDDAVITGYGFTDERDALFVFNRFTGKQWVKLKLRSAPEFIIPKADKLYVRTYDTNYLFQVESAPR
jgi:hypothetical protein